MSINFPGPPLTLGQVHTEEGQSYEWNGTAWSIRKSYLVEVFDAVFPIGSIHITIDNVNPGTKFSGTTWVADGVNRALVGAGANVGGAEFGWDNHTLTTAQLPAHAHSVNPPNTATNTTGSHQHALPAGGYYLTVYSSGGIVGYSGGGAWSGVLNQIPSAAGNHSHTVNIGAFNSSNAGSGNSHSSVQASEAFYIWRRTA
jgi:microcystin-dependent protein